MFFLDFDLFGVLFVGMVLFFMVVIWDFLCYKLEGNKVF